MVTPEGEYKIKYVLYRKDRIKKIPTKLKKIIIRKNLGWCDDPSSKDYNKLIKIPFIYNCEKLHRKDGIYDIIVVINFNMNPIIKNKGSAIFIHIAKKNYKKTKGCIALKKKDLLNILTEINKNTKVKIADRK